MSPLKIGITGGIGTGKSVVCSIFECLGVPAYYADDKAKQLMQDAPNLVNSIKTLLGDAAYTNNREIDRNYIAQKVFHNPALLTKLNGLVHPAVKEDFLTWVQNQKCSYIIEEAALMYESGSFQYLDKIIVVDAPFAIRMQRILKRDPHRTKEQISGIIENQMDQEEKKMRADYVLDNSGTQPLLSAVLDLHKTFSNN